MFCMGGGSILQQQGDQTQMTHPYDKEPSAIASQSAQAALLPHLMMDDRAKGECALPHLPPKTD